MCLLGLCFSCYTGKKSKKLCANLLNRCWVTIRLSKHKWSNMINYYVSERIEASREVFWLQPFLKQSSSAQPHTEKKAFHCVCVVRRVAAQCLMCTCSNCMVVWVWERERESSRKVMGMWAEHRNKLAVRFQYRLHFVRLFITGAVFGGNKANMILPLSLHQ